LPGASNAFTIAHRLGLNGDIINDARGLVGEDAQQIEAMLAEIKGQTEAARRLRHEAETTRQELMQRLAEIDAERRDILDSARADARREIKAARERIRHLEEEFEAEVNQRRAELDVQIAENTASFDSESLTSELDELAAGLTPAVQTTPPKESRKADIGPIKVGDMVFVAQFSTKGQVVGIQNGQAEVQLGHFRATVPLGELERTKHADDTPGGSRRPATQVAEVDSPGVELDLRGQVAEEAILSLDQYLDRAFRARLPWVRIIHGRGSGTLRQVVRQELRNHPLISTYRPGKEGEGGDGVTVVHLAVS
jgi:DNA mismatch repair protein MutS2